MGEPPPAPPPGYATGNDSLWLSLLQESSDFSLVLKSTLSEKLFISYKASATLQVLMVCPVWLRSLSSWGIPLVRYAEGC